MRPTDKFSEELLEYTKDMAKDDWECGHPFDHNDVDEFRHLLRDEGFYVSIENAKDLFDYYFEQYDLCRDRQEN